jgi:ArsR family transcriptional regulator, arsenate/arsenite/antimonite-responsive transcriptional repressor
MDVSSLDDRALIRVLKALAEPRRLRMIQELAAAGELTCSQIGARFPLSQPTISHHLKVLSDAGLLVVRREAQHVFVSVNHGLLDRVLKPLPARSMSSLQRSSRRPRHATPSPEVP